jgi:hypothetical protein
MPNPTTLHVEERAACVARALKWERLSYFDSNGPRWVRAL